MRSPALLVVVALGLFGSTTARAEPPHIDVGIGEQSPALFEDPRFRATGIRHARLIVPFDLVQAGGWQLAAADVWLWRAREAGIDPLVSFAHSSRRGRQFRLPKVRDYRARVREFRARYPWVRTFATWNEANHRYVQPTGRHPERTAAFYRALRRECPAAAGCTVVAVEVLLTHSWRTWSWLRRFRSRAGRGPHIWGLHNYPDVTRLRSLNTRLFMRRVPRGKVWFTETGGLVRFGKAWPHDERRAARAVRFTFRLAASSRRVGRVYLYSWLGGRARDRWDSGLFSVDGRERRAYGELLDGLALARFRVPPAPVVVDLAPSGLLPGSDQDD